MTTEKITPGLVHRAPGLPAGPHRPQGRGPRDGRGAPAPVGRMTATLTKRRRR